MQESFLYILRCCDGSYYTGMTNNLNRRLYEHNSGLNPKSYTFNKRPIELMYYTSFTNIYDTINREKQIKSWSKAKKEALIDGRIEDLPNLAKKDFEKK
nr:GIY-YIG nuclease family protein [uncultured Brumimicrobium sp.]